MTETQLTVLLLIIAVLAFTAYAGLLLRLGKQRRADDTARHARLSRHLGSPVQRPPAVGGKLKYTDANGVHRAVIVDAVKRPPVLERTGERIVRLLDDGSLLVTRPGKGKHRGGKS
ncbi:membrane protein [Arthrobacter phage Shambre1]|uniref:Membrane protein n=1 Tax=Arthrobacter phage Shambre1 TaxID=2927284 RepID=A0A977KNL2_9CAUD|nr:membrane protein [Arthrobacter phage Shambre1]UXE04778.1 membrane protein [Arthrobacter phage Shambre1]